MKCKEIIIIIPPFSLLTLLYEKLKQCFSLICPFSKNPLQLLSQGSGRRFSKDEEDLLYTEVLNHWEALFGERNQLVSHSSRCFRVWTQITTQFNAAAASGARPRDLEELRKKWNYLKNHLKAKLAPAWASEVHGGGQQEQATPQLTPLEERIAIRMRMITAKPEMSVDFTGG